MSSLLEKIREGGLPDQAKESIARGVVPLEPEELILALFLVCGQGEWLAQARETFASLPDGTKLTFFENRGIDADVTDFYLRNFTLPIPIKMVMLLNPRTKAVTISAVAADLEAELLDVVVNNQVKILEDSTIIDSLNRNTRLSINQKQRIDEYTRLLLKSTIEAAEVLETKSLKEIEDEAIADAREFVRVFGKESGPSRLSSAKPAQAASPEPAESDEDVDDSDMPDDVPLDEELEQSLEAPTSSKAGAKEGAKEKLSVLEQIASMSVPQKVQAAIKGDREVRSILIRDANKLVCSAVIKSPRITDAEVEFYANLRNVQTDVLRLIAQNREWTKSYKVIHNLVRNPRTPITFSTKFMSRLNKKDLRALIRDRGVPEVLRTMARRMSASSS